jgi:glucan phosphoethanolaminetransferase (alkaline phosphatase superfamily)
MIHTLLVSPSIVRTTMNTTVFTEMKFWLLIVFSGVLPFSIYGTMLAKKAISRRTILALGFALVVIAGVDIYLLQILAEEAKRTHSLADDVIFSSEISLALYLLPAMFGGIGINVISHVLVRHLDDAENEYLEQHPDA